MMIVTTISELKERFLEAEKTFHELDQLWEERRRLEHVINEQEMQLHASRSAEEAQELRETLKKERARLQEIDHRLDYLDEQPVEQLEEIKQQLVHAILEAHPEEQASFDQRESQLTVLKEQGAVLQHVMTACDGMSLHLQALVHLMNQSFLTRAILYVWGKSFTAQVSDSLAAAGRASERALETLPLLRETFSEPPMIKLADQLQVYLEGTGSACRGRWNFRKLRELYIPAAHALTVLIKKLQDEHDRLADAIHVEEDNFDAWVKRF